MKAKKSLLGVTSAALAVAITIGAMTAFAAPNSSPNNPTEAKTRAYMLLMAEKYGVDPTGLTNIQIKQAIAEKDKALQVAEKAMTEAETRAYMLIMAKKYGVDPTGLTNVQIKQAIAEKDKVLQPDAAERPMTEAETRAYMLIMAKKYGVDPTGLTNEQIKKMIVLEMEK